MKKMLKTKLIKSFVNEKGMQISSDALIEINKLFTLLITNFLDGVVNESLRFRRKRIMVEDVHSRFSIEYNVKPKIKMEV